MIEIINILKKRRKTFGDVIKIVLFGFFSIMLIQYLGHLKPIGSEE